MSSPMTGRGQATGSHRPRPMAVFAAAFVAGAAAAVGLNRAIDIHLAQKRPQVERESIFVALHALPQGSPVTVWDVALRDWPKAMLPATAMRASDTFEGLVLKHPLREGQPILAGQLVRAQTATDGSPAAVPPTAVTAATSSGSETGIAGGVVPTGIILPAADAAPNADARVEATPAPPVTPVAPQPDLWLPGEQAVAPVAPEPPLAKVGPPSATRTDVDDPAVGGVRSELAVVSPVMGGIEGPLAAVVEARPPAGAAAPVAPAPPGAPVMQYLVMPERIATQAERSFVSPPVAGRPSAARPTVGRPAPDVPQQGAARTAPPMPSRPAPGGRQTVTARPVRQPQAGRQPTNVQPTPKPTSNRQSINGKATSAGQSTAPTRQPRPAAQSRPPAPPAQPADQSAATAKPKTMFPYITAGLAAVEKGFQRVGIGKPAAPAEPSNDEAVEAASSPATIAAARKPASERTAARPRTTGDTPASQRQFH